MSNTIHVMVVLDTIDLENDYPHPSHNPDKPTGIKHRYQYMITDRAHAHQGNATADLEIKANSGDTVYFTGTTLSHGCSRAVIIYGLEHWKGDPVLDHPFKYEPVFVPEAVHPSDDGNGLPPQTEKRTFHRFRSYVKGHGKEHFYVRFAVYNLNGGKHELYGYFFWDPTITTKQHTFS